MVAIFKQQGCQIAGFPRISCILVVFILFSTWKNNCGGYTHTFDDNELNTLFFKLVWIAGLPYLHNRVASSLVPPRFHAFFCNLDSNQLRRIRLVAIPTYLMTTSSIQAFSNLSEFHGCHIYTTGLPDCWFSPDFMYFGVISTLINLEEWF